MDFTTSAVFAALLIVLAVTTSSGLPTGDARLDEVARSTDKRPKYMDTREDFEVLKQTVLFALNDLVEDGKVSPAVLTGNGDKSVQKRMYMGICMRQQANHFIPYPCMRSSRR